ncbi:MAG: type II toxin-antitoxin system HicA family toxin [Minisyncoccia bacterium]
MSKLPPLSGDAIVKALKKTGYVPVRLRGSHLRLVCSGKRSITVPRHPVVGRGLLRKILRDAELSPAEFIALL